MNTGIKGSKELFSEVIEAGLCTVCGACSGSCPYLLPYKGQIRLLENCVLSEGQCYQYCPRTFTDLEIISQKVFGKSLSDAEFGYVEDIYLARTTDPAIGEKSQDGGCVTTCLTVALAANIIDAAVETKLGSDKVPGGFIARTSQEILECAGVSYEPSPVLTILNSIPEDSTKKIAVVGLPCHVASIGKMKVSQPQHRFDINNIKLTIGLFCGWELSGDFHDYLRKKIDVNKVTKFDIPHHPAHSFDAYIGSQKTSIDLDEIAGYISGACSYCWDMTAEFADISIGSGRSKYKGWNTVIARTPAGAELIEIARKKGALEVQPIPSENLENLKKAALNKKKKAVSNLAAKSGDPNNLLYFCLPSAVAEKLKTS